MNFGQSGEYQVRDFPIDQEMVDTTVVWEPLIVNQFGSNLSSISTADVSAATPSTIARE